MSLFAYAAIFAATALVAGVASFFAVVQIVTNDVRVVFGKKWQPKPCPPVKYAVIGFNISK